MVKILEEICNGCAECIQSCPTHSIRITDGYGVITESCINCKLCVSTCGQNAIVDEEQKSSTIEFSNYSGVCIIGEIIENSLPDFLYELIGEGRKLALQLKEQLSVILIGKIKNEDQAELIKYGVDRIFRADIKEADYINEMTYVNVCDSIISEYKPGIVLIGATILGRAIAPRLAARLQTGLTADCTGLEIRGEDKLLLQIRPAMGESLMATIVCKDRRPQMATVRPHVFPKGESVPNYKGDVIEIEAEHFVDRETEVLEIIKNVIDKKDRDIIVAGGRGMGGQDNFNLLLKLAEVLEGDVGATRPVIDEGWATYEHQIGQTGKIVAPKLYFAFGISGAIQHIMGMNSSDIVVAVNKDPNARIFDVATYGIVGDAVAVVQEMIKQLEVLQRERINK